MDYNSNSKEGGLGPEEGYSTSLGIQDDYTSSQQQQQFYGDVEDTGLNQNDNMHPHHLFQGTRTTMAETTASTKYLDYPIDRPFLNSDYPKFTTASAVTTSSSMKMPVRTVNTYPTSDRDAVISALKNLQDKVKKLELERTQAEQNLQTLASETEQYKDMLNHDKTSGKGKQFTFGSYMENGDGYAANQAKELEGQLTSAENRCRQLELQLENMRTMVHTSERNRRELMERTARVRQDKDNAVFAGSEGKCGGGAADTAGHMDRLNELERDQMRLTATQTLAETKIRELEEKVKEERVHRRLLQERTAHLESETKQVKKGPQVPPPNQPPAHAPRIPVTAQTPHIPKKSTGTSAAAKVIKSKKPPKKKIKKKAAPPKRPHSSPTLRDKEQNRHYRLNLAEIPFVAGKSTSASHSLGANVQKVLAMMKSHNKALCASHPWSHRPGSPSSSCSSSGEATESSSGLQDLGELLNQLQDEFGYLCSQQQEVMTRLHEAHASGDFRLQTNLEAQLDTLVSRMEAKSGQISKIRQHQQKLENGKKLRSASVKTGMKSKRPHSAGGRPTSSSSNASTNGHNHQYSHNYYQNNNLNGNMRPKPHSCNKPIGHSALGNPALFMLRDMKKLQSTLRKDDLSWE
ncbi:hypothetical protein RRG08_012154 [Elysia crispata]|uniref:Centrosomal protein 57 n=1 Tax=Elysia crispata TaxID=231223 RepID=A0AAE0ZKF4_9GAST|nr:hypothetical protein RRG08_012154 [Elysia crispata]